MPYKYNSTNSPLSKVKSIITTNAIQRAEFVEINIQANNTAQTIYFPDLPNLRNSKILGIQGVSIESLTTSENGAVVFPLAGYRAMIVGLYFSEGTFIKIPMMSLVSTDSTDFFGLPLQLSGQTIVWSKSYIYFTTGAAAALGSTSPSTVVFNVYYNLQ
jgi:hypothetical protein